MLGILFLILGIAAAIVTMWQLDFMSGILGTTQPPDYTLAGISFTAAIIFFGLWLATRFKKGNAKASALSD